MAHRRFGRAGWNVGEVGLGMWGMGDWSAPAEMALRFILSNPATSTVIPGMRRRRNVESNISGSDVKALPRELLDELKKHRWERTP
ncbi:MAG: aldo/keto reductase [Actinomycetota bacterium]